MLKIVILVLFIISCFFLIIHKGSNIVSANNDSYLLNLKILYLNSSYETIQQENLDFYCNYQLDDTSFFKNICIYNLKNKINQLKQKTNCSNKININSILKNQDNNVNNKHKKIDKIAILSGEINNKTYNYKFYTPNNCLENPWDLIESIKSHK